MLGVENLHYLTFTHCSSLRSLILPNLRFSPHVLRTITSKTFRQVIFFNIDHSQYPWDEIDEIFADHFPKVQFLVVVSDSRHTETYAYMGELCRVFPKAAQRGVIVLQCRDVVQPHNFLPSLAK